MESELALAVALGLAVVAAAALLFGRRRCSISVGVTSSFAV